jgi:adenylate cyclase class 2
MSFEKEIKILDIDVLDTEKKLSAMGAEFISKNTQKIYTYDLPIISHRLDEIIDSLKNNTDALQVIAYKQKLETLLIEAEDLLPESYVEYAKKQFSVNCLSEIVNKIQNIEEFEKLPIIILIKKLGINPNKWIRLRKSGNKTTLTVKHVFNKNDSNLQKVGEFEVVVDDIEEANHMLVAMGFAKRNVQEKIRTQYKYKNAELDIDEWPRLKPYLEIESDDETIFQEIIEKCGFQDKDIVSCNTEELYKKIGINIKTIPELLF